MGTDGSDIRFAAAAIACPRIARQQSSRAGAGALKLGNDALREMYERDTQSPAALQALAAASLLKVQRRAVVDKVVLPGLWALESMNIGSFKTLQGKESEALADVDGAVTKMDIATQKNAALVEEVSAAATSLEGAAAVLTWAVAFAAPSAQLEKQEDTPAARAHVRRLCLSDSR